jgi:hypothetical protein
MEFWHQNLTPMRGTSISHCGMLYHQRSKQGFEVLLWPGAGSTADLLRGSS